MLEATTLIQKTCANPQCGKEFSPSRKDNMYCSGRCRLQVHKSKKHLGTIDLPHQPKTVLPMKKELTPPVALDISAQFVIDNLKEQKEELKKTIEKQAQKIEDLTKEKIDLEKELASAEDAINKKPSALSGLLEDKEFLLNGIQQLPQIISAFGDLIKKGSGAPQISGTEAISQQQHPLIDWISKQPKDVQDQFTTLIKGLAQNPTRTLEFLSFFNRSMMSAGVKIA